MSYGMAALKTSLSPWNPTGNYLLLSVHVQRRVFLKLFRRQATGIFSETQMFIWRLISAIFCFKHFTVFCQKNRLLHQNKKQSPPKPAGDSGDTILSHAWKQRGILAPPKAQPKSLMCSSVLFQSLTEPGLITSTLPKRMVPHGNICIAGLAGSGGLLIPSTCSAERLPNPPAGLLPDEAYCPPLQIWKLYNGFSATLTASKQLSSFMVKTFTPEDLTWHSYQ